MTDPRKATADTELVGDPTCRRFVMRLCERAGSALTLTSTVANELAGNVRQSEKRHWARVLKYQADHTNHTYDADTAQKIVEATQAAAARWLDVELKLPRLGGHLNTVRRRCPNVEIPSALRAGVSAPDG